MPIHNQPCHNPSGSPTIDVEIGIPIILATAYGQSGQAIPSPHAGRALIDTGASGSAVDQSIIQALGLQPTGQCTLATPSQTTGVASVYTIRISFPQAVSFGAGDLSVIGCDLLSQGIVALIGRDVLSYCVLVFNGPAAMFTLTF